MIFERRRKNTYNKFLSINFIITLIKDYMI